MIPPVAISFLKSYWKEAAAIIMIGILIAYVQFLRLQRDNISLSFTNYRQAMESAAKEQEMRNSLLKSQSDQRASINEQVYSRKIESQQIEIKRLTGDNAGLVDINSGLRNAAESNRSRLSEILSASRLPPESEQICDTSSFERKYRALELACIQTTIDYNSLRKWVDDQCEIYGCM